MSDIATAVLVVFAGNLILWVPDRLHFYGARWFVALAMLVAALVIQARQWRDN